jgi:septum formation protein
MELILGTGSRRRREILDMFSIPFQQVSSDFDETQVVFQGGPAAFVKKIACRKAEALQDRFPDAIILTADTTVYRAGRLFEKPATMEEAFTMLREHSGKVQQVFTGVAVSHKKKLYSEVEATTVHFCELTDSEIDAYLKVFYPLDKAGGYTVQNGGSLIVKRLEGCYYNVMGLPLQTVRYLLLKTGIDLWDYLKSV